MNMLPVLEGKKASDFTLKEGKQHPKSTSKNGPSKAKLPSKATHRSEGLQKTPHFV